MTAHLNFTLIFGRPPRFSAGGTLFENLTLPLPNINGAIKLGSERLRRFRLLCKAKSTIQESNDSTADSRARSHTIPNIDFQPDVAQELYKARDQTVIL